MLFSFSFILPIISIVPIRIIFFNKSHLLISLLLFERLILIVIINLIIFISFNSSQLFLILILLTLGACEARLGLSCLVVIIRSYGNDIIINSSIVKC